MKVELIKHPTDADWLFCRQCTLNTIGKSTTKLPTNEWKKKLIESEHSPIRTLWFGFKLKIPYYVSVHLVRHKFGVEHFVSTQRTDRTGEDRTSKPQDAMVSHIMYINAAELMHMCHMRLCAQASKETRAVVAEMARLAKESNPEFENVLVAKCDYRNGVCTEFFPCGKYPTKDEV